MTDEPMTKAQLEELLNLAIDKGLAMGKSAAQAEAGEQAQRYVFSNGATSASRGNQDEYEDALRAKTFELRGLGVRRIADHADILAIKEQYGR